MNDLLLLANLLGGPLHGYALKKQATLITGSADMHNNLVYPLLRRFVARGWVRRKSEAGERGQRRLVYSLTPEGKTELLRRLSEFGEADAYSSEAFQLRVGLFRFLNREARALILEQRRNYLELRDQKLAVLQEQFQLTGYSSEVVKFLRTQIDAELSWVRRLNSRIEAAGDRKSKQARNPR